MKLHSSYCSRFVINCSCCFISKAANKCWLLLRNNIYGKVYL